MDYIEFDEKKAYSYTEAFIKSKTREIKEAFRKRCKDDKRYSKEYIAHISNLDNINVNFRQNLKYDIVCEMSYVSVDYSYDYTFTYSTEGHLSGSIKLDTSTGKADASGLHMVKDYDSSTETKKGTTSFFSTEMKKCICHFGNYHFGNYPFDNNCIENYTVIPLNSSTDRQYKKLNEINITKEFITQNISFNHLPEHVNRTLKESALEFSYGNPRNFTMKISDYRIKKAKLIIFPIYVFDVFTEFEGQIYKSASLTSPNDISSRGPLSNHYEDYKQGVEKAKSKYATWKWPTGKIYILGGIISFLTAIGLIVILSLAASLGNIGFALMYKPQMIVMIIAMLAVTILTGVLWNKKWICVVSLKYSENDFYNPRKSVDELMSAVTTSFHSQKKKSITLAVVWLILTLVISAVLSVISVNLYKKTDIENYWYTPDVVETYEGYNNGAFEKLEILSCDDNGKVEAIYTSTYKGMTAQMKYDGQITRKDHEETLIELKFTEWIINPGKGSPDKTMYIYFYHNNYNKVSGSLNLVAIEEKNYD